MEINDAEDEEKLKSKHRPARSSLGKYSSSGHWLLSGKSLHTVGIRPKVG